LTARFVARGLSSTIGQQFIVENKPGAGGLIGFTAGVEALPDGYTVMLISIAYAVNPSIYKLKFDPINDITPIIQISQGPQLIVANPSVPVKSMKELIALAKSEPDVLNVAYAGQGGVDHITAELFAHSAGIRLNRVPYKGASPALIDTIGGQTDLAVISFSAGLPHVRAGRLRALAVTTPHRVSAAPDIPTVAESGVPGYEVVQWYGLAGPKGLPPAIVTRINGEVAKVLASKEAVEHLQQDGQSPVGGTPEQLQAWVKKEVLRWNKVVAELGIKAE
jgi:tripartite-type tricarboxylate transporter receptor subunit TctC